MSEMTIGHRIHLFAEMAKGAHENPDVARQAQNFFKTEIMGFGHQPIPEDPSLLSPNERSILATRFGDALSRTAQTLTGTEFQTVVTFDYLLRQIADPGTRHTLQDLGRQFTAD